MTTTLLGDAASVPESLLCYWDKEARKMRMDSGNGGFVPNSWLTVSICCVSSSPWDHPSTIHRPTHHSRREYKQQVQAAQAFETNGSSKANKVLELLQHKYVAMGFGSQSNVIPPFYIIGNWMLLIASHQKELTYRYDFCIAIAAHLGYHWKHTLQKQTKARGPGKAMYIRPLRPTDKE